MQVQSKIICPECRKEAIVPAGGVKDLPNNFIINRLVNELVLKHKVEGEEVKCDCDEDKPVVAYCPECKMFFCLICNDLHKCSNKFCGHGIVPLTEPNKSVPLEAKLKMDTIEKHSDQEALSAKKQKTDRLNELNINPLQSSSMKFVPIKESFPHFDQQIDPGTSEVVNLPNHIPVGKELEFFIITKYHNGNRCSIGGSQVSVRLESNTGEVTTAQVMDKNDGSYMASFVAEQVGEIKLSVSINGQQIKGSPCSLVIYDYTRVGKPSKIVNNDGNMYMVAPWGIAFDKNGTWAVTDNTKHCVYIFDGQDQLIREFGNHGSGNGQLNRPEGVTFDSNNYLYVADVGNNRIQKFDVNGNYLLQFDSSESDDDQLNHPIGITTYNNKVFVTEVYNQCISVFNTNGQFSHIIGKGRLGGPIDVTVNTNNLLVADYYHHCIHTFTLDGNYVSKFATLGPDRGQLSYPRGITTDLYGFILVSEYGNVRVSIFDKDGNFIHCFGSKGSDDGKFQLPHGIALSPNGDIYVTDYGNKRIQIFSTY